VTIDNAAVFRFDQAMGATYAGVISGDGSVSKAGTGELVLTGESSGFTGTSAVVAGGLQVNGTLGGAVDVASGAALGGSGAIDGAVTIGDGGALLGAQGHTLSMGSLVLESGAQVAASLGAAGGLALFDVAGDLTLDGTLDVADAGGFGAGVYRLMTYGGSLTDNGLAIGTTPAGAGAGTLLVQTAVADQVNLISTAGAELRFWDGGNAALHDNSVIDGGSGTWTVGGRNWTGMTGILNGPYQPNPALAVFQGAAGMVTVEGGPSDIAVTGIQFAVDGYRVAGDAIELAGADGSTTIRVGDGSTDGTAMTATIASSLTGDSRLVKSDLGTLILTGSNTYAGGTAVAAGTLRGDAGSIRGDIANAGMVLFDQGSAATFGGDIAGFAGTEGAMLKEGTGTLTLAGMSALDWTVQEGGLVSATDRFAGDVLIGADGVMTFAQGFAGSYGGAITGAGDLAFEGGGVITLTGDTADFAGLTSLEGTTLVVNRTLGGTLSILQGGRLQGSGTVGTTTVGSGGTIAPGNSIGTLHVAGDLTFAAGSLLEVEVDPQGTASDLLAVTGTATLNGGSVVHVGVTGTYKPTSTYTILTAGDGVAGTFDTVSSDFAFLDPTLGYGANAVTLTLERNDITFVDVAQTANQRATAGGVESLTFGNPLYDAVVQLDKTTARSAFDQLSGEIHASAPTALIEDSRHIRDAATGRLRAAFGGVGAAGASALADGSDEPAVGLMGAEGLSGWGHVFGSRGQTDSDGNAAALDHSTAGLLIGADALIADTWRLGLLAGTSRSNLEAEDRASSGESDNYHLGLYGGTQRGALGLRAGAAYTRHDVETSRAVAFAGFGDSLEADTRASTTQVFGEVGYTIDLGSVAFEPFASLAYVNVDMGGFSERGGGAALTSEDGSTDVTFSTLGVRAASEFRVNGMPARARGMVGWRHAFGDVTPTSDFSFTSGDPFTIAGVPIAEDSAVVEAGFEIDFSENATLGISYGGQFGSGAQDHSASVNFSLRF
jgi:outer membrane autotransporter protein